MTKLKLVPASPKLSELSESERLEALLRGIVEPRPRCLGVLSGKTSSGGKVQNSPGKNRKP